MKAPKPNVTVSVRAADQPGQRGTHGTIVVRTKSSIGSSDLRTRGAMRLSGSRMAGGTELRNHSAIVKRIIEGRDGGRGAFDGPARLGRPDGLEGPAAETPVSGLEAPAFGVVAGASAAGGTVVPFRCVLGGGR